MSKLAITVGNTEYDLLGKLPCCHNDLIAVNELLGATANYVKIKTIENANADSLRSQIRDGLSDHESVDEVFFYFTGHGCQHTSDFFFCATNFDTKRPNETGLSNSELHDLLKTVSPNLVVKVIDACNSGMSLIKSADALSLNQKGDLRFLIQIASCLDSQNSPAGDPLSPFTEKFCLAATRKAGGSVFYTDITATLRDEYLNDAAQTPHFISQGTGRDLFVDDSARLEPFKLLFRKKWMTNAADVEALDTDGAAEPTLLEMLQAAETKMATPEQVQAVVANFFDTLTAKLSSEEFSDFFEVKILEHSDYLEHTARGFIIRILSNEKRPDNFVTTASLQAGKQRNPWIAGLGVLEHFYTDDDFAQNRDLKLNCPMQRAQICFYFTPKYRALKEIVLIASCIPSLEHCYIFEIATEHSLKTWKEYDDEGSEIVKRWYKRRWDQDCTGIIASISTKLKELIAERLDAAAKRLAKQ